MDVLTLRAHHLLCSRLFSGHGYNDEFAVRMGEVVSGMALKNYKPEKAYEVVERVRLICSSDYVCEKCPNLVTSYCNLGDDDVKAKDRKVLKYAGLEENNIYTLKELADGVEKITKEQFEDICGTCRWFKAGYCSYKLLELNFKDC